MAIASNFPAIRPSLNLDFANAKALDPRITFSRASAATYYDGKTVAKAEENLLLNSAILATQSVTTRAEPYTLSFIGTGTVTLSGTSTAGPLVGTGAANRVSLTFTPTAGTLTLTVNGAVEQAQLEARSVATAYTPTTTQPITNYIPVLQTAPAGVPRFDHNPVTGESLGLLVEEQRTNLITYSEFPNGLTDVGTRSNISLDYFYGLGPSPVNGILFKKVPGGAYAYKAFAFSANTTYSVSVYVKMLDGFKPAFSGESSLIDFAIVIAGAPAPTSSYTVENKGNGVYRVTATVTTAAVPMNNFVGVVKYENNTNRSFIASGYQVEAGAFATSYIKTEASQVTRAADSAAMTGANFSSWYRNDEGTLFAESILHSIIPTDSYVASIQGVNVDNAIRLGHLTNGSARRFNVRANAANTVAMDIFPASAVNTVYKQSAGYKVNDFATSANGSAVSTAYAGFIPSSVDNLRIGASAQYVRRISYYPKRLTDAQLQALTA